MTWSSMKLAAVLWGMVMPGGIATAQHVAIAETDAQRSVTEARAIIDRLGRPAGAPADKAGADKAGAGAREETARSWLQRSGAAPVAASAAVGTLRQPGAVPVAGRASTRIGKVGGAATSTRTGKPAATRAATGSGRPRGSRGGTTIVAMAENVVTIARNGSAVTEIGAGDDVGNASVSAENIVTIGRYGDSSATRIGTCSGTVRANGIFTEGGTTEICAGRTSRDGKTCLEIYRTTCIIHWYIRPKNSPCAPGYWTELRKCRLPSDTRHAIYRN